jgi:thioesterase domain-containing protein
VAVHEVAGDHYSIVREPNVSAVAEEIARALDAIEAIGQRSP